MRKVFGLIIWGIGAVVVVLIVFAALSRTSSGSGSPAAPPSSAPSSEPSSAPVAAASSGPCTAKACIVADAEGLKGTVAKDNAVMTKVTCKQSTVKKVVAGTWTVHCTITYSDGMVARGIASVLTAGQGEVDWEPTTIVDYGSGG